MLKAPFSVVVAALGLSIVSLTTAWNSLAMATPIANSIDIPAFAETDEAAKSLKKASLMLQQGDVDRALAILKAHENQLDYSTANGKQWVDLFVAASITLRDYPQLINLYHKFPEPILTEESASLHIGNALISFGNVDEYSLLRSSWKGRENKLQEWLFLDVDAMLMANQTENAVKLLQAHHFTGAEDSPRLVRLALLTIKNHPKEAWDYLTEAGVKDPQNPDIHTYRARLLESVGKNALAMSEYTSAVNTAPSNIFLKDQLADFYLRHGQFAQALSIWLETLNAPSLDSIWLKVIFWSRMITPISFDWTMIAPPVGKSHAFNLYLLDLAPGQLWDEALFARIPNARHLLATQQATFWLRLLDHLKNGREELALNLLQANPFAKESWNSSLEQVLRQILIYRKTEQMPVGIMEENSLDVRMAKAYEKGENPFFAALKEMNASNSLEDNKALQILLKSDEVFAAAFISEGWLEAGLQLHAMPKYSEEFPEWVSIGMMEALSTNRSPDETLKFAMQQPLSPQHFGLVNILIRLSKNNSSINDHLYLLAQEPSEMGIKAAWLSSLLYIENGDYPAAARMIMAQPQLADSILGKETLARIALLENDVSLANSLYQQLEEVSAEAKSYLARRAFAEKDWDKARQLTEALLEVYPGNPLLQENLRKIFQESEKRFSYGNNF